MLKAPWIKFCFFLGAFQTIKNCTTIGGNVSNQYDRRNQTLLLALQKWNDIAKISIFTYIAYSKCWSWQPFENSIWDPWRQDHALCMPRSVISKLDHAKKFHKRPRRTSPSFRRPSIRSTSSPGRSILRRFSLERHTRSSNIESRGWSSGQNRHNNGTMKA